MEEVEGQKKEKGMFKNSSKQPHVSLGFLRYFYIIFKALCGLAHSSQDCDPKLEF